MALDLRRLRDTVNSQLSIEDVLATPSIYKVVNYLQQEPPISMQEAQNYLKNNISKMLLWTMLYSILSVFFVLFVFFVGLLIFGLSSDTPNWSKWIKIPIMLVLLSITLQFYLLPIATLLSFLIVFFSGLYLVWGNLESNHSQIAKIWCFIPDTIQDLLS